MFPHFIIVSTGIYLSFMIPFFVWYICIYIWRHEQYELPAFGEANDKVSRYLLSQRKTFIKLVQKASLTRKIRFIITVKSNIILRLLCKKKESKTHRMRLTFKMTHIWTRLFYDDSRQASAWVYAIWTTYWPIRNCKKCAPFLQSYVTHQIIDEGRNIIHIKPWLLFSKYEMYVFIYSLYKTMVVQSYRSFTKLKFMFMFIFM